MTRDEDLMRDILFRMEAEKDFFSAAFATHMGTSDEERREEGHVKLLVDAGLVAASGRHGDVYRITNAGHDFIAAIRNDTTWNKTKEIAHAGGVMTVSVLFDVAVQLGKQKIKQSMGIEL